MLQSNRLADSHIPWLTFILLTVLFFLIIGHDFTFPQREHFDASAEMFEEMIEEGNPLRRIALAVLVLWAVGMLFFQEKKRWQPDLILSGLIIFLIIWSITSILWSEDQMLTLRRLSVFVAFWLTTTMLALRFPIRYLPFFTLLSATIYLVVGLGTEIASGTFTPFLKGYRFMGTIHPNVQGENCALLFLSALILALSHLPRRKYFFLLSLLALIFLILSKSRTSFVSALLAVLIFFIVAKPWDLKKLIALCGLSGLVLIVGFIVLNLANEGISTISYGVNLGRDIYDLDTLNGRLRIWNLCLSYVSQQPLLGYGYDSFWTVNNIVQLSSVVGWGLKSTHSAYIELLLSVGITGTITFLSMIGYGVYQSFKRWRTVSDNAGYGFIFLILVFFLLQGLLESRLGQMGYGTFLILWGLSHLAVIRSGETA
jgi:exopolysaccharide production protein ExoQ